MVVSAELLPHALERMLQLAELVAPRDVQGARVVALADAVRRADQSRDRPRKLARDEPGAQQAERHQRQRDAREEPPHALELAALLMLELGMQTRQRRLHPGTADPDFEGSPAARPLRGRDRGDGLGQHQRLECGGADLGGAVDPVGVLRILAAEQHRAAGVAHLHALDVAFLQQAPRGGGEGGLVMGSQRGGEE